MVAVVHQPRLEIFRSFDDLLLLAPGGVTAYIGPNGACPPSPRNAFSTALRDWFILLSADGVIPYFQKLGFEFAGGNNPADQLLDFVAGRDFEKFVGNAGGDLSPRSGSVSSALSGLDVMVNHTLQAELSAQQQLSAELLPSSSSTSKPAASHAHQDLPASSKFFARQWAAKTTTMMMNSYLPHSSNGATPSHSSLNADDAADGPLSSVDISADRGASFLRQLYHCHNRSVLQQYRQASTYALEMGVATLAGGMMGAAATAVDTLYQGILQPPYTLMSPSPIENLLPSIGFYVCLAVGLAGSPAGVLTFGEEKMVYYREAAAGHNTLAYYIGKTISVIYRFVLGSLHFAGIFMLLAKPVSSFGILYLIVWTQFFCVYGLGKTVLARWSWRVCARDITSHHIPLLMQRLLFLWLLSVRTLLC